MELIFRCDLVKDASKGLSRWLWMVRREEAAAGACGQTGQAVWRCRALGSPSQVRVTDLLLLSVLTLEVSAGGCAGLLLGRGRNGGGCVPKQHLSSAWLVRDIRSEMCGVSRVQFLTHASLLQLLEIWGEKNNGEQHVLVPPGEHRVTEAWLVCRKVRSCGTVASAGSIKFWKAQGVVCVLRWAAQLRTFYPSR